MPPWKMVRLWPSPISTFSARLTSSWLACNTGKCIAFITTQHPPTTAIGWKSCCAGTGFVCGAGALTATPRPFVVKRKQAVWAEYLLCRAGVPLACDLLDPRNAEYPEQHPVDSMPVPWTEKGIAAVTLIDHFGEWLAKVVG